MKKQEKYLSIVRLQRASGLLEKDDSDDGCSDLNLIVVLLNILVFLVNHELTRYLLTDYPGINLKTYDY